MELAGHAESFQLDPTNWHIYVSVPDAKRVQVIDREKQSIIANWEISDAKKNHPMAHDAVGHRLFVVCRDPSRLLTIDTATGKTVASVECVGDADDIFYDATMKQLYISGGEGFVDVFAVQTDGQAKRVQRLPTAQGARTALFLPSSNSLYVAAPRQGDHSATIHVLTASPAAR
jgi:DNA-binding beta-propeller fold protein YncE